MTGRRREKKGTANLEFPHYEQFFHYKRKKRLTAGRKKSFVPGVQVVFKKKRKREKKGGQVVVLR